MNAVLMNVLCEHKRLLSKELYISYNTFTIITIKYAVFLSSWVFLKTSFRHEP